MAAHVASARATNWRTLSSSSATRMLGHQLCTAQQVLFSLPCFLRLAGGRTSGAAWWASAAGATELCLRQSRGGFAAWHRHGAANRVAAIGKGQAHRGRARWRAGSRAGWSKSTTCAGFKFPWPRSAPRSTRKAAGCWPSSRVTMTCGIGTARPARPSRMRASKPASTSALRRSMRAHRPHRRGFRGR